MMWISMEPPEDMSAESIIEAKVELLRCIETLRLHTKECFLGQFGPSATHPGYLDDETVPSESRCPTFASLLLRVDNTRWRGVPFLMTAGKGVDERLCEVRHGESCAAVGGREGETVGGREREAVGKREGEALGRREWGRQRGCGWCTLLPTRRCQQTVFTWRPSS